MPPRDQPAGSFFVVVMVDGPTTAWFPLNGCDCQECSARGDVLSHCASFRDGRDENEIDESRSSGSS